MLLICYIDPMTMVQRLLLVDNETVINEINTENNNITHEIIDTALSNQVEKVLLFGCKPYCVEIAAQLEEENISVEVK